MIRYNAPRPIQAPDYLGAATAQGLAANQRYGQQVAQQNANKSGLYGLGATGVQQYGPALAKALSTSSAQPGGVLGQGMVSSSSPEVAGFMSSGLPGAGGVSSAGAPVGLGASGAGSIAAGNVGGTVGTGTGALTATGGTAGALSAAELAAAQAAADAAGVSVGTYLASMAI